MPLPGTAGARCRRCERQTRRRELGGTHVACVCLSIVRHCTRRYSMCAISWGPLFAARWQMSAPCWLVSHADMTAQYRRGPSMYEMEGPRHSRTAQLADRSAAGDPVAVCCRPPHKPQSRPRAECRFLGSPRVPGCCRVPEVAPGVPALPWIGAPFFVVSAFLLPLRAGTQELSASNLKILWPSTGHLPFIPAHRRLSTAHPHTCPQQVCKGLGAAPATGRRQVGGAGAAARRPG